MSGTDWGAWGVAPDPEPQAGAERLNAPLAPLEETAMATAEAFRALSEKIKAATEGVAMPELIFSGTARRMGKSWASLAHAMAGAPDAKFVPDLEAGLDIDRAAKMLGLTMGKMREEAKALVMLDSLPKGWHIDDPADAPARKSVDEMPTYDPYAWPRTGKVKKIAKWKQPRYGVKPR